LEIQSRTQSGAGLFTAAVGAVQAAGTVVRAAGAFPVTADALGNAVAAQGNVAGAAEGQNHHEDGIEEDQTGREAAALAEGVSQLDIVNDAANDNSDQIDDPCNQTDLGRCRRQNRGNNGADDEELEHAGTFGDLIHQIGAVKGNKYEAAAVAGLLEETELDDDRQNDRCQTQDNAECAAGSQQSHQAFVAIAVVAVAVTVVVHKITPP